ncbi:Tm-1-like ATP-binding domain-containing protein [Paenibacillus sp.]|uniref:Tm-1-like ATP-binding domain-containing protein n=1 Tax=Paenibacillus sp. TaxID=58172 RepID=UPI002D518684|nr:Tm-1-like ATP-binding domain-containing protein [Paenibacillus sp.]HZG55922.1 Tm-1-like ATP-binding domain-containing protein [Paenibacillus sp.]
MAGKAILIGALDTKGVEFGFVKSKLEGMGVETLVVDVGVLGDPAFPPDIGSGEVAQAGGTSLEALREANDRGAAVAAMTKGVSVVMERLLAEGVVGGVFGMGGTAGTTVGAAAMQAAPIGVPKLLVSTVASGNTRPYVGVKDVVMMHSVVDIAGLNKLSSRILANAAYALGGMILEKAKEPAAAAEKPTLGMTMFGVTTPCCNVVRELLEARGYDLLVFHATGAGGLAMEELIRAGYIQGVADVTTTELADELVGGIFSAGPTRLEAAADAGIPQVVSVGALDMVNFGPPDTVPERFKGRKFYQHNPTTTLMRTTVEENAELGKRLAEKLNRCRVAPVVVFPKGGVSLLDRPTFAFDGAEERQALYDGIKRHLRSDIPFLEVDGDINDPATATLIAEQLLERLEGTRRGATA